MFSSSFLLSSSSSLRVYSSFLSKLSSSSSRASFVHLATSSSSSSPFPSSSVIVIPRIRQPRILATTNSRSLVTKSFNLTRSQFWSGQSYLNSILPARRHLSSLSSLSSQTLVQTSTTKTAQPFRLLQSSCSPYFTSNCCWNRSFSTTESFTSSTMPPIKRANTELSDNIDELIASSHVVIFSFETCKFCDKAKALLNERNANYLEIVIDQESNGMKIYQNLQAKIDRTSVPQIFIGGQHIGGCDDLLAKDQSGELAPLLREHKFDYDLIVIGGGSGGLAASKEAASLGKSVVLLDYVTPTPQGTSWGLGGTCVNVGCIPKKLMHHASLVGQEIEDSQFFGWLTKDGKPLKENLKHDWGTLVQYVQNNIKGSNFTYKGLLRSSGVKYINAYGSFVDQHQVKLNHKNGKEEYLTAKDFIISTGERPRYPLKVEGALQYSITSDDLFSLPYNPGKTLVVGASYVALECAGFLKGIGNDVSVMVRSIVLRGFDRQCSELIHSYMKDVEHVRFIETSVPKKIEEIEKGEPGRYLVTWTNTETQKEETEEFNTVMFAIGRDPCTKNIGLENVGVTRDKDGKVPVVNEQTNVSNIYAIGDILQGKPQLTPVAIEAGILLARRLYGNSTVQCDYLNVPTTVFTPLEYGSCGYTEEQAIETYGEDNIEIYHQYFSPTEWRLNYYDRPRTPLNSCYAKVIVTRSLKNDPTEERLLGFHYVGPFAGEVTQFLGIPLKLKATKADLDALIGIHPTCAEILTTLTVTKRSGKEPVQQGCCG